jgi:hypothetical protein
LGEILFNYPVTLTEKKKFYNFESSQNSKPPVEKDPEKEKKRIARKKERRATLILGLVSML